MYLIVVGGGNTGRNLVDLAIRDGHDVVVIETDQEKAAGISEEYDCLVLNADATVNGTLVDADVDRADAIISTTNVDAANIMVMLLAREHEVPNRLSVVHDPQHLPVFEKIGVNVIENPKRLIAEYLYNSVQYPGVDDVVDLGHGIDLIEISVSEGAPVAGLSLAEAKAEGILPKGTLVVAVKTANTLQPPDGSTLLDPGEEVDLLVHEEEMDEVIAAFGGK